METLFAPLAKHAYTPLADRIRPQEMQTIYGQEHIVGEQGIVQRMIAAKKPQSLILWGPPGCGKTTLAKLVATKTGYHFEVVSAVTSGTAELRKLFEAAEDRRKIGQNTVLLVDEIHRFNRSQQDLFLPYIENGTIVLIGATTENPSFALNGALLSRCKVLTLHRLSHDALLKIIERAETIEQKQLPVTTEARTMLVAMVDGDGRYLLNICEELFALPPAALLTPEALTEFAQKRMPLYDKAQDGHYNLISALHKSLRGSDPDAALYWANRMLDAGEDPLYLVRRLVRFAVEDIGLADPEAVHQALAAKDAYEFLGSPEGELAISQAVLYLATAPKSNANYTAYKAALKDARQHGSLMPPKHILNAPTQFMANENYGKGYIYDHDTEAGFSGQDYFPESMGRRSYYAPVERGFEREVRKRLEYWKKLREGEERLHKDT